MGIPVYKGAFGEAQAHDQSFIGSFARGERRFLGDAVAVASQRGNEIFRFPVTYRPRS